MPDPAEPDWEATAALEVSRAAAELGAVANQVLPAFPWIISGLVDGVAFYFRERGGEYVIAVAAETTPAEHSWPAGAQRVTIASGLSDDPTTAGREDPARAVRVAVGAVRTWLRQRSCTHDHDAGDRYCRSCGIELVDPTLP